MPVALLSRNASQLLLSDDAAAPLPTEFKLFALGVNKTLHGDFVLDAEGAAAILAQWKRRGVDMQIDLNHDSLDKDKRLMRSDAADSMGSFVPELRADGLWATRVCWSSEGARRLRGKLQRYTSPAAHYDTKTRRITALHNAALCSDPATYEIAPLVAASREGARNTGASLNSCNAHVARVIAERFNARRKR